MEAALVAATVSLLLAAVVAVWTWRFRRSLARRLEAVSARLETSPDDLGGPGLEALLARLERAAGQAVSRYEEEAAASGRLADALATVEDAIVVADDSGTVVYRNPRAAALLDDRHTGAIVGQSVDELLGRAASGEEASRTVELFGPPRRSLVLRGRLLEDGRRRVGTAVVVEDVSERRRIDAVRRDFVANISHELKTPIGALGLLAETLQDEDDIATARRFAGRMQVEAQRVAKMIDDLLDLTRLEAEDGGSQDLVPVDVVVAQAVERVRPMADHRSIVIDAGDAPGDLAVVGDRRQLVSAVHNLVDNAVKYSNAGAKVQVRVRSSDAWIDVVVRDQGIGIPRRDIERIFERFYRVDRARSRETGGTGLGLAIVRHVAANHGGEIRVSSHEGRGSTFTLRLPNAGTAPRAVTSEAG